MAGDLSLTAVPTTAEPKAQEASWKRDLKDCKSQKIRKAVVSLRSDRETVPMMPQTIGLSKYPKHP